MSATNGAGGGAGGLRSGLGGAGGVAGVERPGELRSAELVSRLLAATPPYLYNMPLVPHSYFFSEMLRSFVHAKNSTEPNRQAQGVVQPPGHRRSRKRSWNQSKISPPLEGTQPKQDWSHRSEIWNNRNVPLPEERHHNVYEEKYAEMNSDSNKSQYEKPLELTINKNNYPRQMPNFKFSEKSESEEKPGTPEIELQNKRKSPKMLCTEGQGHLKDEKYPGLLPPTGPTAPALTLPPPPPPLWYPPIYPPPYGIDPLNFFIDLRVSGHIYDRKHGSKEAQNLSLNTNHTTQEPSASDVNLVSQIGHLGSDNNNVSAFKESVKSNRHVSAFSVPKPRDSNGKLFPINLCHSSNNKFNMKYYDDVDVKAHERNNMCGKNPTSTHYVMQNLKRIYGDLTNRPKEDAKEEIAERPETEIREDLDGANNDSDTSESKKKRRKDLRALIGLELVVDYVKSGKRGPVTKCNEKGFSDEGRDSSSDVEVLGEHLGD